jgi:hypothetical protein
MISGIFENCIGTEQAQPTLQYWAELGYREIQTGHLSAEASHTLYGHASNLTSIRLQNGNSADHGLVRVMVWEQPRNAGLQKSHPFVIGSRWFASLVQDIYAMAVIGSLLNRFEESNLSVNPAPTSISGLRVCASSL